MKPISFKKSNKQKKIDYSRVMRTFEHKELFTAGYENGWIEFFRAGQFVGSIKTRPVFFEGLAIDFFNGYFQPPTG